MLHDGPGNTDHVRFLEGVLADQVALHLAGQHHHGNRIHVGGGNTGDGIGGAGAGGDQHHAGLAGGTGIAVRRMGRRLFMAHQYVGHLAVLEQGVVYVQNRATGIAENVLYTFVFQSAGDHFAAG